MKDSKNRVSRDMFLEMATDRLSSTNLSIDDFVLDSEKAIPVKKLDDIKQDVVIVKHNKAYKLADTKINRALVDSVYDALTETVHDVVVSGRTLSLNNVGTFKLTKHKGHSVQFKDDAKIEDYVLLKFSASKSCNQRFRDEDKDGLIEW